MVRAIVLLILFAVSGVPALADDVAKPKYASAENARTAWSECVTEDLDDLAAGDKNANNAIDMAMSECSDLATAFLRSLSGQPLSISRDDAAFVTSLVEELIRDNALQYLGELRRGW